MPRKNKKGKQVYQKVYYEDNKERILKYKKEYTKINGERIKSTNLKTKYGITLEDYNQLFNKQEGKCAICNRHQSELKRRLFVDHCHETNEIRGLLCHRCNSILGYCGDDIQILENAIKYLKK